MSHQLFWAYFPACLGFRVLLYFRNVLFAQSRLFVGCILGLLNLFGFNLCYLHNKIHCITLLHNSLHLHWNDLDLISVDRSQQSSSDPDPNSCLDRIRGIEERALRSLHRSKLRSWTLRMPTCTLMKAKCKPSYLFEERKPHRVTLSDKEADLTHLCVSSLSPGLHSMCPAQTLHNFLAFLSEDWVEFWSADFLKIISIRQYQRQKVISFYCLIQISQPERRFYKFLSAPVHLTGCDYKRRHSNLIPLYDIVNEYPYIF